MHSYAVDVFLDVIAIIIFLISAYYFTVAVFSLAPDRKIPPEIKANRYAVIIPAHNEERVIEKLIQSIKNADYEKELISVFVVADGCIDRTAEVAKMCGATVIEKGRATCKGDALKFAIEYLKNEKYDCVAVFDADNEADSRFFREMDEKLALGADAVQGYIDSKNPYSSWVANSHSIWYWITNRITQTGRERVGLGVRLGGTGFVLRRSIIEKIPWTTETIAEDAEYTCKLALAGIRVSYAQRAVVYDEKPTTLAESVMQRKRWTCGIRDVQGEYTTKLLFKGKFNALLGLWGDMLYPLSLVLLAICSFADITAVFSGIIGGTILNIYLVANIIVVCMGMVFDKKLNLRNIFNIFGFILYMISWIIIGAFGVFTKTSKGWYHTIHKGNNS